MRPKDSSDPTRWLDQAGVTGPDAPPAGFEALLKADTTRASDHAQLARIADGLAARLEQPAFSELVRTKQAESAAAANPSGMANSASFPASAAKLTLATVVAGALTFGIYQATVASNSDGTEPPIPPTWEPARAPQPAPATARAPANGPHQNPDATTDDRPAMARQLPPGSVVPADKEPETHADGEHKRSSRQPMRASRSASATKPDPQAELSLLSRAQQALAAHPARALSLARTHARRYRRGTFAQEREMIAIEALIALDRPTQARVRGRRFMSAYPGSGHGPRLQELLGTRPEGNDGP